MPEIEVGKIISDEVVEIESVEEQLQEDKRKEFYRAMLDELSLQEEG